MTTIRDLIADGTITLDTVVLGTLPIMASGEILGGIPEDDNVLVWCRHPADGSVSVHHASPWWSELDDWRTSSVEMDTAENVVCRPVGSGLV